MMRRYSSHRVRCPGSRARSRVRALAMLVALALTANARADLFWIEYDASCGQFPEEVGWDRLVMSGGDQRSLDGGVLTLDSSAGLGVIDCYGISHPVDLGVGESFLVEWRLRVDEVVGAAHPPFKPAITVGFDGYGGVTFAYAEGSLYSVLESTWIDFDPNVFHDYSLTTSDLLNYTLSIDGSVAHTGRLETPCYVNAVGWGDKATGATSVSEWEYVRFGVIPEPSGALLIISACLAGIILRARTAGTRCAHDETR
jgi:hypothetical protein